MNNVLLDTNFFINLLDKNKAFHKNANDYFIHFTQNDYKIYLSTVVVGEFCVKDSANNLPLDKVQIVSYNFKHAELAGEYAAILYSGSSKLTKYERLIVNNDIKLFAQAQVLAAGYFVTTDKSCGDHYRTLKANRKASFGFLDITMPITDTLLSKGKKDSSGQISLFI